MDRKGITYFNDVAGLERFRKCHTGGYRNIYSLAMEYMHFDSGRTETVRMDYGSFSLADEKRRMEISIEPGWGGVQLRRITMSVSTYHGTEKLHEDVLMDREFSPYKFLAVGDRVEDANA